MSAEVFLRPASPTPIDAERAGWFVWREGPPWLLSVVVHLGLLAVLASFTFTTILQQQDTSTVTSVPEQDVATVVTPEFRTEISGL